MESVVKTIKRCASNRSFRHIAIKCCASSVTLGAWLSGCMHIG